MKDADFHNLAESLRKILVETEAMLKSAAAEAGDGLDTAGGRARESLRRARGHLRAAEEEICDRAHSVDHVVRAHPWQTVAAAGAIAFLLGLWMRRR